MRARFVMPAVVLFVLAIAGRIPMLFMPMNVTVNVGPKRLCNAASLILLAGAAVSAWQSIRLTHGKNRH